MTLQQLRYVVEVATRGSISAAAAYLYIAQPSLSKAISELERELGVTIFERSPQGVLLTEEGDRFLAYARQVVDQIDLLEAHYVGSDGPRKSLCVSCPHEAQLTHLFAQTVRDVSEESYEFTLREVPASIVIEDVRQQLSDFGIIYRSEHNRDALDAQVRSAGLHYTSIAEAKPHVLVRADNALAQHKSVSSQALSELPRVMLGWVSFTHTGLGGPLVSLPPAKRVIRTTDRETQKRLVAELDGYMMVLSIGSADPARGDLRAVVLSDTPSIEVGMLTRPGFPLSPLAREMSENLHHLSRL